MILVSILGDFHSSIMPIFFEFKEDITHHIIVYDDSKHDQNQFDKILEGQRIFIKNCENLHPEFTITSMKIKEDSYEDIIKCFEAILKHTTDTTNLYLNATDGLSSIGIVLSSKFLQSGANVLSYDRYANTYNLHTKDSMKKHQIKNNLDIKNHLFLKGYTIKNFTNRFTLEARKKHILEITKNLPQFKSFAKEYVTSESKKGFYRNLISQMNNNTSTFVHGGIFEEYIYWLIKDHLDVDDIMTGVVIEYEEKVSNEIDILFIKNNHLHFIECKFSNNFKTTEYIYKGDSILQKLDDDGKGMILSVSDKNIGEQDKARSKYNNLKTYYVKDKEFKAKKFLESVCGWFDLRRIDK